MYFLLLLLAVAGGFGGWVWLKRRARARLLAMGLSDRQRAIVAAQVPLAAKLPGELRGRFEGKINLFLDQVRFIGCNGLEVTEEMQLSIAAQACLLVANSDTWYENISTVLIYPDAFTSKLQEHEGYVVRESRTVRLGESWSRGPIVLSWAHSEKGALRYDDGHNVVFHEFAHQIDDLSGQTDGVPVLAGRRKYADWQRAFSAAYERHLRNVEGGHLTVLDDYGAEGPEEFFAVAVEVFFEKPKALKREEPEVYAEMAEFFRLDPESWG